MKKSSTDVSVPEFFRLYHDKTVPLAEMCERLGITKSQVYVLRNRHRLRPRHSDAKTQLRHDDPTPEEIAIRAAECRARRSKEEKARMERAGRQRWSLPAYVFNGRDCSFTGVSH